MRILMISNLFPPEVLGGYEILCEQVCHRLHARGHELLVLTTGCEDGDLYPFPVHRRLRLVQPFSQPATNRRWQRWQASRHNQQAARQAIAAFRPELVFVWSQLRLTTGAARAAEASGVPVAYTMNDEHIAGYKRKGTDWKSAAKRLVEEKILRIGLEPLQLRNTTCISNSVKQRLLAEGVEVAAARVIFQGIPIEKFTPKAEPGSLAGPWKVLYAGQLHRYKGVHTVVEAVARLHAMGLQVELTLCGQGDAGYEAELQEMARQGPARVTFRGRVPHEQLAEIYRTHSVFVFPSTWAEPFGLTHLEAMACGTPVVSTAEGGHGEFLVDGRNALVFAPGNAEDLAQKLRRLLESPQLARQLAANALAQVQQEFSLDAYVDRLEAWLAPLAGEQQPREPEQRVVSTAA